MHLATGLFLIIQLDDDFLIRVSNAGLFPKKITIGPFNRERRLRFCSLKINWSVENDCDKIIFSDETKVEIGANKIIMYGGRRMNNSTLTVLVLSQIKI